MDIFSEDSNYEYIQESTQSKSAFRFILVSFSFFMLLAETKKYY